MASSEEYLQYVLDQLSGLEEVTYRKMMGEYILYYQGKIFGGIYDDRLLIKDVSGARDFIGDVSFELPYEGAKPMILVESIEKKDYLVELVLAMVDELPAPKKR